MTDRQMETPSPSDSPLLESRRIGVSFGAENFLFRGLDIRIEAGDFVAVVGSSGCGKTTLLKTLGGFHPPTEGDVRLKGRKLQEPSPEAVMVFQDFDQLFPWKTVWSNVAFPLKIRRRGRSDTSLTEQVSAILEEVGLLDYRSHFPFQLSGGMKQRTALARALVSHASLLLMDEPFGSLDAQRREELQRLLLRMWAEYGFSVLFVTHDISEALLLADRVLILEQPASVSSSAADSQGAARSRLREIPVTLPRPRSSLDAAFREAYREIYNLLKIEK